MNPDDEAAHWNLGIAATMLGRWAVARKCWNTFGMKYEINDEDPAGDIGRTPIRLNPDADAEVVWATRICPARAVLYNIPFPESGHGYRDVVLNDGAPNGYRTSEGVEYAVLDELQRIERSAYQSFSIKCRPLSEAAFEDLRRRCREADIAVENWTTVRLLCRQCSEGKPHEAHDEALEAEPEEYHIAFASANVEALRAVLQAWEEAMEIYYYDAMSYFDDDTDEPA